MDAATYLQINLIPIAALIIMRLNTDRTLTYSWRSRVLRFMMVLLAITIALNMVAWMLDGKQFSGTCTTLWICNMAYYILMDFMTYLWYLYVQDVVDNGIGQRGIKVLGPSMPLLVFFDISCVKPMDRSDFLY